MKLLFASANLNKLNEIRKLLPNGYTVESLTDKGYSSVLEESGNTLEANALQKARFVNRHFQSDCFADDSGLEVLALNGEPGVHSAHYAGNNRNDEANVQKLLQKMNGVKDRRARFVTVIALIINGKELLFEGHLIGQISDSASGTAGFGYDPVFIPDGYEQTLAELGLEIKNTISHRKMAINAMVHYLTERVG